MLYDTSSAEPPTSLAKGPNISNQKKSPKRCQLKYKKVSLVWCEDTANNKYQHRHILKLIPKPTPITRIQPSTEQSQKKLYMG